LCCSIRSHFYHGSVRLRFGQKFRPSDIITALLTFCGISIFFFGSLEQGQLAGNVLGVLSGVFMACMFISVGRVS
jgi:drug/metabolite transporter (DMT)-like permease